MHFHELREDVLALIGLLVESGLADRQRYPHVAEETRHSGRLGFDRDLHAVFVERPYAELYDALVGDELFHVMFPDGGLLQFGMTMNYGRLTKQRLAFYPNPWLKRFDDMALEYLRDEVWGHVVSEYQTPVACRFDFDESDSVFRVMDHPRAHLTLGQYPNCRIPLLRPISPSQFVDFVCRNFYSRAFRSLKGRHRSGLAFAECIHPDERNMVHLVV